MPHVLAIATRSHTEAVAKEIGQMLDRREAGRDIWTRTSCRWPPEESPQCGFLCLRYASSSVDVPHRGVGLLTKDFVGSNDRHDQGEKQKFACLLRSDRRPALRLFHDDSRTPSGETDRRKFPASRSLLRSHRPEPRRSCAGPELRSELRFLTSVWITAIVEFELFAESVDVMNAGLPSIHLQHRVQTVFQKCQQYTNLTERVQHFQ